MLSVEERQQKARTRAQEYYKNNKTKVKAQVRDYQSKHKLARLLNRVKSKFGLSKVEYVRLLESQDRTCAICGGLQTNNRENLDVDHNHATNEVRGLLCGMCNRGLGQFRDNPDLLAKAASYLLERGNHATNR